MEICSIYDKKAQNEKICSKHVIHDTTNAATEKESRTRDDSSPV